MNWSRIAGKLVSLGIIALSMIFMTSCGGDGGDGNEVVHLYIFNGYPGTKSMNLYGPSGTIVTGLGYGQRTAEPVAVDRNLGTNFKLVLDGAPQTIELSFELFSLYPHETGTLLLKRRSEVAQAEAKIYRHVQSRSEECRLVFDNSLSLNNAGIGLFGYIPLFEMTTSALGGYSRGEDLIDRGALMDEIDQNRYFALVPHFKYPADLMLVYVGPNTRVYHDSGVIRTFRPTEDFNDCLGEDDPTANAEKCSEPVEYTTHVYQPASEEQYWIYYPRGFMGTPNSCNATVRIISDFTNIFDQDSGILRGQKLEFPHGSHMFWVLYGRPVNPGVFAFHSNDADTPFVELPPYPGE